MKNHANTQLIRMFAIALLTGVCSGSASAATPDRHPLSHTDVQGDMGHTDVQGIRKHTDVQDVLALASARFLSHTDVQ